jgi:hypothetical protein
LAGGEPVLQAARGFVQGTLFLHGGSGANALNVYDFIDPYQDMWTITNASLTRTFSGLVNYSNMTTVTVLGSGTQSTTYNVESTAFGTAMTIYGGTGDDVFNISPSAQDLGTIRGPVYINGGGGADQINLFDCAVDSYTVTDHQTTVAGLPGFHFTYDSIASLTLTTRPENTVTDLTVDVLFTRIDC